MKNPIVFVLLLVLATALGFLAGRANAPDRYESKSAGLPSEAPITPKQSPSEGQAPSATDLQVPPGPADSPPAQQDPEPKGRESIASADARLFSQSLLAHARKAMGTAWSNSREESLPNDLMNQGLSRFRESTLALPETIGQELANAANEDDQLKLAWDSGDVHTLITFMSDKELGPFPELVQNPEQFESFFQRSHAVVAGNHREAVARGGEPLASGTVLSFPAGVFRVADFPRQWSDENGHGQDITIRGAGMNNTLLVLNSDLSTRIAVKNLILQDCTIFTGNNYLFDLRREPISVKLIRMRLCGFDKGSGSSCAFGTEELALHGIDSIISGGYGRHPGGRVFDVRNDGLLVRFEGCTLTRTSLGKLQGRATAHFSNCRFVGFQTDMNRLARTHRGVSLAGCSTESLPKDAPKSLSLEEIFPNWQQRLE